MLSKTANSDLEVGRNPIKLNALDRMRLSFAREQISRPSGSIETLLRERLGDLILLPKSPTIYTSFRELVLAFEADWRLLEECREKWMQFLQTVVQFVSSGDHRLNERAVRVARYIEDEWRRELLADLGWPLSNSLALEARLSNLSQSESQRILSKNIDDVVKTMATHMTFQLEKLVERCVLGQIEWHGEQACQYSFIDRGFYSPVDGTTLRKSRQIDSTKEVIRSTYVTEISATKAVSIHIHDLVDAVCSPISLAISTIPRRLAK